MRIIARMSPDERASWPWPVPYDFAETTRLLRTGRGDPVVRREPDGFWRTARTAEGPATVRVRARPKDRIDAEAWGPGAVQALAAVPGWIGLHESPWQLPAHPVTDRLLDRFPGVRLTDGGDVFEALVNIVLQQLVTWNEAAYTWRRLVEHVSAPAPGPQELLLPPAPEDVRRAGVNELVALGIGHRRVRTLYELAFSASRIERIRELPTAAAFNLLCKLPGIGQWTAAMTLGLRLGRPEPVVFGDVHLPHTVCWALAGEPRGNDARMAELLEPFGAQVFRVLRLLLAARIDAPRRAPKREVRFGREGRAGAAPR